MAKVALGFLWFLALSVGPAAGATLYVVEDALDDLYILDPGSGNATLVGPLVLDASGAGLAYDTSTETMYVSSIYNGSVFGLGVVDLGTGEVSFVGSHANSFNISGLAYDIMNDVLYGADIDCLGLATLDRATGMSSCIGLWGIGATIRGLAYCPAEDTLYGIDEVNLYTLDRISGGATLIGPHGADPDGNRIGLECDPDTGILYGANKHDFFVLDTATGTSTPVGTTGLTSASALASVTERPIFADDFESGDTGRWDSTEP